MEAGGVGVTALVHDDCVAAREVRALLRTEGGRAAFVGRGGGGL